jgi:hypothetical protein
VPNNTYGWGRIDALAAVELAVALRNHAPVAIDDAAVADQGGSVAVDVLANDADPDGDELAVVSFGQGANGAVTGDGGTLTYRHDGSSAGPDSFTYTVADGRGGTDTATVAVTVLSPAQTLASVVAELDALIASSPGPSADKLEDARAKLQTALAELGKSPPARQAALGAIEGAVGELETAVAGGHLGAGHGAALMDRVTGAARQPAVDALAAAIARGGGEAAVAEAERAVSEGDTLRAAGSYKAAVSKYRDALAKAESA